LAEKKYYVLPDLPYAYNALEPYISEQTLRLHHDKHHAAYVNNANNGLKKLEAARQSNTELDIKALLKDLSFNVGGLVLHNLFWDNMTPATQAKKAPSGTLADVINGEFGSFDRFKKEFTQAANSAEGSGWAALSFCKKTRRPIIMQVEKHNVNVYPAFEIIMVLDIWEHAYYVDYKNERAKFVDAFWNVINWGKVNDRLEMVIKEGNQS
jgi:superoxide dismutase, Fe-Mn family